MDIHVYIADFEQYFIWNVIISCGVVILGIFLAVTQKKLLFFGAATIIAIAFFFTRNENINAEKIDRISAHLVKNGYGDFNSFQIEVIDGNKKTFMVTDSNVRFSVNEKEGELVLSKQ